MDIEGIRAEVVKAFARNARPDRFTDRDHCCECAEHDDTLRQFDPKTIGIEQLGNPGWDPMCFVLPDAFRYYFPAMVRLALEPKGRNSYLDQFLFHVTYQGENSRFFGHFTQPEREATLRVLQYVQGNMKELVAEWDLGRELDEALELWYGLAKGGGGSA